MQARNCSLQLSREFVVSGLSIKTVGDADCFIRKLPSNFDALHWLAAGACVEQAANQSTWIPKATAAFEEALRAEGIG